MNNSRKLSKSYAFSIEEGFYIASGCVTMDKNGQRESIFEGYVPNIAERESFWIKIKEARADQRNCCIFKNKEEYVIFLSTIQEPKSKRQPHTLKK
jgi:hypothetical protein